MRKNKVVRRILAVVLTGAVIAGMFMGCSKKEEAVKKDSSAAAVSTVKGIDGWKSFGQKVTLKVAVYDRGAAGVDSVANNGYTQYVQKEFGDKYNIALEFIPITRSDVMTDYALLAAANNLPTILMEYDYPKVTQWASDGYLQTFDMNTFAHVAPTYYKRMQDLNQLGYSKVNGETYFVLAERPYHNTTYTYVNMCRLDWLEKIGYKEPPKNYKEYCDVMDKLIAAGIAKHPAGGWKKSAVADFLNFNFREFPNKEEEWAQHSSLSTVAFTWDAAKRWMKRENAEYNKGYKDPEYFIIDLETAKANFINGKTFSFGGYMSSDVDWLNAFYKANPSAKLAVMSPNQVVEPGVVDFAQMRSDNPYGMTIGFGNTATAEQLTAAWMYMEWCTLNIKELQSHTKDWRNFNNSKDFWCVTVESVKAATIEEAIAAISPKGLPQDFTQPMINFYYELKAIADAKHAYTDPQFSVAIKAESEYSATLLSLAIEYYDKLVMAKPAEFDAMYAKFAQEYLKAGYQQVIDERLAAFKNGKSTKLPK